ncbi:MAG TPA: cytochrome c [Terriglobia bacterium]|nr:cytochrome c [Terriglobia bacterium]
MSRRKLNTILLVTFVATVALNWFGTPDLTRRSYEYFPNMARSARYNAFEPNPNFGDGKTLQPPVPGTIPRGFHPLRLVASKEDAIRAGEELQNPFSSSDARALERGQLVFGNFCQACHGAGGRGDGPVALRGFPAPPSLLADKARNLKDGQIFHILSVGQGNMPSYAAQILQEDRWKAVLYVRKLQQEGAPAQPKTPSPLPGQPQPARADLGAGVSGGQP